MHKGFLAIALHAHLPYVRHPEYDNALEENWLYEAMTETYIPLLLVLERLKKDKIDFRITLSITPTLAAMLNDQLLQEKYLNRLDSLLELADLEIKRTLKQPVNKIARFYKRRLNEIRNAYIDLYNRNLICGFKKFQETGMVEIIASAATHGYLPLLSLDKSAVHAQIKIGIENYQRLFDKAPDGFWLPECGFYEGIDEILFKHSIRYTILETHGITHAHPRPNYGVYEPLYCPSGTAVFGRDPESTRQVWSSSEGYPGDSQYREFYRDIAHDLNTDYLRPFIHPTGIRTDTGFKYSRVTGKTEKKELYNHETALKKAAFHAADFVRKKEKQINEYSTVMNRKPVIVAPYDAELFGHWWYEGPEWLNQVIRIAAEKQSTIKLIHFSEYLDKYPTNQISNPSASSWGNNGFHETWLNESNDWIYPTLHRGITIMKNLANHYTNANGLTLRALRQAARELLLAQSSDWAFMINSGRHPEYAIKRTKDHLAKLERIDSEIRTDRIDEQWLSTIENQNKIFPQIDYGVYGE